MAANLRGHAVSAYGKIDVVTSEFMKKFHATCRECGRPSRIADKELIGYVERKLRYHHRCRDFLLAGYVEDVTLAFTHIQKKKREEEILWDPERVSGVLLGSWERGGGYLFVIYQIGKFPVAVVRDVYPEERVITCAASWQSQVRGNPPDEDYSLQELLNAIMHIKTVDGFNPSKKRYEKLDVKQLIQI